jgi:hypothetical protein
MAKKKGKTKKSEKKVKYEQSMWSVRINSQTLYKKPIDGRTILLGMNPDEQEKVAEVLDKAFDELSKILEKRTTMHEAPEESEQITQVDTTEIVAGHSKTSEAEKATKESSEEKSSKDDKDDGEDSLLGKLSS